MIILKLEGKGTFYEKEISEKATDRIMDYFQEGENPLGEVSDNSVVSRKKSFWKKRNSKNYS